MDLNEFLSSLSQERHFDFSFSRNLMSFKFPAMLTHSDQELCDAIVFILSLFNDYFIIPKFYARCFILQEVFQTHNGDHF